MAMTDTQAQGAQPQGSEAADDHAVADLGRKWLWVDTASGVKRLIAGLMVLCVLLFVADFVYHRHTKVPYEGLYGFYAIAGFVSFTVIVLGARLLRLLIRRDEQYYAPDGVDAESYPMADTQRLHHDQFQQDSLATLIDQMSGSQGESR